MWQRGTQFNTALVTTAGTGLFDREGVERATNGKTSKGAPLYVTPRACWRCGGAGGDICWEPTGYTCYRCGGNGVDPTPLRLPLYTADKLAKLNGNRDAARARKAAAAEAKRIERETADEAARVARREALKSDELFVLLSQYAERNDFIAELVGKYRVRDLSDAQAEAGRKAVARLVKLDEARATSEHIGEPGQRVAVAGVAVLVKCIHHATPGDWVDGRPDQSRWLVRVETDAKCVVVWFTSNPPKQGERLDGKATVKARDSYDGVAQTVVKNFRAVKPKRSNPPA